MKNIVLTCLSGLFICFYSCTSLTDDNSAVSTKQTDNLPYLVTTTGIIGDVVKNIVKNQATVVSLMGPGVDPHLYIPTQSDISKLRKADMIFYNGLKLEDKKMEEILIKLSHSKPVISISKDMKKQDLRTPPAFEGHYDPHVWFDIELWSSSIDVILDALVAKYPNKRTIFTQNAKQYKVELAKLDKWIIEQVNEVPKKSRVLITTHDAFGYFGKAYGVEVKAMQGISTSAEIGLKDVTDMINFIISRGIHAVFVESSVSKKQIEAVISGCRQKGHQVVNAGTLYADALGDRQTEAGTYIGMIKTNVHKICKALK